jgi:hypothetical protein
MPTPRKPIPSVVAERLVTGGPTGLIWENPASRRLKPGDSAGSLKSSGYFATNLGGSLYKNHRIVWFLETGEQPPQFLDHINGNSQDNRVENLRPATEAENKWNSRISLTNTSGVKGVYWNNAKGKWYAQCKVFGKKHHLGCYTDLDEAAEAVARFREQHHGDFANHG